MYISCPSLTPHQVTLNTTHLDYKPFTPLRWPASSLPVPWSVIGLQSLVAIVMYHCTIYNTWLLFHRHLHTQVVIVGNTRICITNEYCTMFHSSSMHKLHNKWILYCVPPLISTSIAKYCIVFHPSSAHKMQEGMNSVPRVSSLVWTNMQ